MKDTKIEYVKKLRYVSAGDYFMRGGKQVIQVVNQVDDRYSFLIALHEQFEQFATELDGISEKTILEHDLAHPEADEPGELPDSPYRVRHRQAELLERVAAEFLGVDWKEYENSIKVSE